MSQLQSHLVLLGFQCCFLTFPNYVLVLFNDSYLACFFSDSPPLHTLLSCSLILVLLYPLCPKPLVHHSSIYLFNKNMWTICPYQFLFFVVCRISEQIKGPYPAYILRERRTILITNNKPRHMFTVHQNDEGYFGRISFEEVQGQRRVNSGKSEVCTA